MQICQEDGNGSLEQHVRIQIYRTAESLNAKAFHKLGIPQLVIGVSIQIPGFVKVSMDLCVTCSQVSQDDFQALTIQGRRGDQVGTNVLTLNAGFLAFMSGMFRQLLQCIQQIVEY